MLQTYRETARRSAGESMATNRNIDENKVRSLCEAAGLYHGS
jgi:hypothetical protein